MAKIGLDFGTTNSAIGLVTANGSISVLGPLPSVGAWKNGDIEFFGKAKERLKGSDDSFHPVRDLKMKLGVKDVNVGREKISALELSSRMMSELIKRAVKNKVELAVLSTPVQFSEVQRLALLSAAKMAGIDNVKLVYEPTAALVGALSEEDASDGVSLIVDWGGGTLDVSVVVQRERSFRELAVGGDVDTLGGSRIDQAIARELLTDHPEIEKIVLQNEGYFERLLEDVEEEKIDILDDIEGEDGDTRMIAPVWAEGEIMDLDPALVFRILSEFAEKASTQIVALLRETHIDIKDITHVVFAGGVCNSPAVRKILFGLFPRAKEISTQNPQLLTAEGCTSLARTGFRIELAANFGVRQSDDSICCVLPDGMSLDVATYRTAEFLLTDVHAPEAVFEFGTSRDGADNKKSMALTSKSFTPLNQLFLPVSHRESNPDKAVHDRIRLYAGVDGSLTVKVHAESLVGNASKSMAITGVPLAIHQNEEC